MDFKPFPKIEQLKKQKMEITQKVHGSNAQIVITEGGDLLTGSRNRWITVEDDNFGFAGWAQANKDALVATLGAGTHFGEWAGPGINSGEGLSEKTFILFDTRRKDQPMPKGMCVVPVLYSGRIDFARVELTMQDLKENGSKLVPGFMRPEGIVVTIGGVRYKHVFDAEDTGWKNAPTKEKKDVPDVTTYLQPIRLEKLLSRDEHNLILAQQKQYRTLSDMYIQDLEQEGCPVPSELRKHVTTGVIQMIRSVTL